MREQRIINKPTGSKEFPYSLAYTAELLEITENELKSNLINSDDLQIYHYQDANGNINYSSLFLKPAKKYGKDCFMLDSDNVLFVTKKLFLTFLKL